jgi:hypothetical protein
VTSQQQADEMLAEHRARREAVIATVMRTGITCYPSGYANKEGCLLCRKGPCRGPVEKYES